MAVSSDILIATLTLGANTKSGNQDGLAQWQEVFRGVQVHFSNQDEILAIIGVALLSGILFVLHIFLSRLVDKLFSARAKKRSSERTPPSPVHYKP